jgi:hypothetical protein
MQELHNLHGVAYGDMAILLRQRTHLDLYADAMQQAGIPFDRGKNNPFYEQPLVLDAIHTAIAIIDPSNEIALTRALLQATATIDGVSLAHMRQRYRDGSLCLLANADGTSTRHRADWHICPTTTPACRSAMAIAPPNGSTKSFCRVDYGNETVPTANACSPSLSTIVGHSITNVADLLGQLVERMRDDPDTAPELNTEEETQVPESWQVTHCQRA